MPIYIPIHPATQSYNPALESCVEISSCDGSENDRSMYMYDNAIRKLLILCNQLMLLKEKGKRCLCG